MSAPFAGPIIGSWRFVRSEHEKWDSRLIYHFAKNGKTTWEVDAEGKRLLTSLKYRFEPGTLTLIYSGGKEREFTLTSEDDGTVRFPNREGKLWWMIRLLEPEPFSIAIVDEAGDLQRIPCVESGRSADV